MPEQVDFKEVAIDWEGYEKVREERWEVLPNGLRHCRVHNTYFYPKAADGEPCWGCYEEFSHKGEE